MNCTDTQLKQALAKMLPDKLVFVSNREPDDQLHHLQDSYVCTNVLDTELLHLCWLVEATLSANETEIYEEIFLFIEPCFYAAIHASWQQRVIALAKVKGIEI